PRSVHPVSQSSCYDTVPLGYYTSAQAHPHHSTLMRLGGWECHSFADQKHLYSDQVTPELLPHVHELRLMLSQYGVQTNRTLPDQSAAVASLFQSVLSFHQKWLFRSVPELAARIFCLQTRR